MQILSQIPEPNTLLRKVFGSIAMSEIAIVVLNNLQRGFDSAQPSV